MRRVLSFTLLALQRYGRSDTASQPTTLSFVIPAGAALRWRAMCADDATSNAEMLRMWVEARRDALLQSMEAVSPPTEEKETENKQIAVGCHLLDTEAVYLSQEWCLEMFGLAKTEVECPEFFMKAVVSYGEVLLQSQQLRSYDIMHEVIRAESGYRLAKVNGRSISVLAFDEFMAFQVKLAQVLKGWSLWEYEMTHWKYYKRPLEEDDYAQLYNTHRLPEFQHVECPAIPLAYRLWSNFPTCPPTRLSELPRFTDAYVSAMTVDNWRSSYRDFLDENYNYNTSFFAGGDPTSRLSKGAHSIFAGVFLQKLPTDMWCYQQVIHDLRPGYIIDLGSSQGGSAVWFASMLKLFEIDGKVITVDLPLDQAYWLSNRRAKEAAKRLKLEDRIDWNYVARGSKNDDVRAKIQDICSKSPCMVVSDSDHDYEHTYFELEFYAQVVGVGQYLVVEDTNIYGWSGWLNINDPNTNGLKRGPMEAANDFELKHRADFIRTDWCAKHYGMSQTPNGWFFRKDWRAKSVS